MVNWHFRQSDWCNAQVNWCQQSGNMLTSVRVWQFSTCLFFCLCPDSWCVHLYSGRSKPLRLSMCTTKLQFKTNTQCVTVHITVILRCLSIRSMWPFTVESPNSKTDLGKGKPFRYECHDRERTTHFYHVSRCDTFTVLLLLAVCREMSHL